MKGVMQFLAYMHVRNPGKPGVDGNLGNMVHCFAALMRGIPGPQIAHISLKHLIRQDQGHPQLVTTANMQMQPFGVTAAWSIAGIKCGFIFSVINGTCLQLHGTIKGILFILHIHCQALDGIMHKEQAQQKNIQRTDNTCPEPAAAGHVAVSGLRKAQDVFLKTH